MLVLLTLASLAFAPPEGPAPGADDEAAARPGLEPSGDIEGADEDATRAPTLREQSQPKTRRFMLGLEAVGMQVPALRSPVIEIDPRFTGHTAAMGGLGAFGRWRVVPPVGFDLGVRSGSVRYRDKDPSAESLVSYDLVMAEAGVSLFVARGEVGHLGLEAGGGGAFNLIRYEVGDERSTQSFGSGFVRAGVGAELLTRRVAFVFALRVYGVMTDLSSANNRGPIFKGRDGSSLDAAVSPLQTFVVGSLGLAYRF